MFIRKNILKGTIEWFNNTKKIGVARTETGEQFFFNSEEEYTTKDPVWLWGIQAPIKEGKLPKANIKYRLDTDIIFNINSNNYGDLSPYIFYQELPEGEYIKINKDMYQHIQTGEIFRFIPAYKSKNNTPSLGERFLHGETYLQEEQKKIAEEKRQKEIQQEAEYKKYKEKINKIEVIENKLIDFIKNEINNLPQREEIIYFKEEIDNYKIRFTSNPTPKINGSKASATSFWDIYSIEDEILNIEETNLFIKNKILEFKEINSDIEEEILNEIKIENIEDTDCPINKIILNGEVYPIEEL